jgi:hypothetical protein
MMMIKIYHDMMLIVRNRMKIIVTVMQVRSRPMMQKTSTIIQLKHHLDTIYIHIEKGIILMNGHMVI